jgi:hypothetical protein
MSVMKLLRRVLVNVLKGLWPEGRGVHLLKSRLQAVYRGGGSTGFTQSLHTNTLITAHARFLLNSVRADHTCYHLLISLDAP